MFLEPHPHLLLAQTPDAQLSQMFAAMCSHLSPPTCLQGATTPPAFPASNQ